MENVYYKAYPQEPPPAYEDIETGGGDFPAPPVHHQSARDFPAQAFPHQSAVSVIEPTGVSYTAAYPPHVVIAQPQNALVSVGTFSQPQYGLQPQNALVGVGTVEQPPYGLQPQNVMVGVGTVEQPPEAPPSHLRLSTFACLACFWCWCVAVAAILKSRQSTKAFRSGNITKAETRGKSAGQIANTAISLGTIVWFVLGVLFIKFVIFL